MTWQGFLRPYRRRQGRRRVFDKYVATAKQDGAEIKKIEAEGADRMVVSANIGLVDAVFLKGNVVGGANGATDAETRRGRSPGRSSRALPADSQGAPGRIETRDQAEGEEG